MKEFDHFRSDMNSNFELLKTRLPKYEDTFREIDTI